MVYIDENDQIRDTNDLTTCAFYKGEIKYFKQITRRKIYGKKMEKSIPDTNKNDDNNNCEKKYSFEEILVGSLGLTEEQKREIVYGIKVDIS